ncbi:hypothetical protein [Umezawaea beigongshangensis]|uniref:hypothetical protein n=1 Tax=Umezawaea beigongshangensis TaxID=2780383 RepID=UPI0018F11ADB|nr:hypothetical protein [Umezawaea beigongshangensis]
MSHQLSNALDDLDKAMTQLRHAVKGIPVRREGFKDHHDTFARAAARLRTEMNYSRSQLDPDAARRRKKRDRNH